MSQAEDYSPAQIQASLRQIRQPNTTPNTHLTALQGVSAGVFAHEYVCRPAKKKKSQVESKTESDLIQT